MEQYPKSHGSSEVKCCIVLSRTVNKVSMDGQEGLCGSEWLQWCCSGRCFAVAFPRVAVMGWELIWLCGLR